MRYSARVLAILSFAALSSTMTVFAAPQDRDLRNPQYLRDHAETRGFSLGRPTRAQPTPDGKAVLYLRAKARVPKLELYEFDVLSRESRLLLAPEDVLKGAEERLSPEEKALRERMRISVGGFADFQISEDGRRILLSLSGKLYVVERADRSVQELKTSGSLVDPKFSPDSQRVAYVLGHDVFVFDLASGKEQPVTHGGSETLSHGLAEFVAREEMQRFSGYWWSPDSRSIAYQETDNSEVEIWHVADPAKPEDAPYPTRYPRPGKANAKVRLGVVSISGGDTVWIPWDRERYPYMTTVRWEEHGPLTLAVQARNHKELQLLAADPATGRTTLLLTERNAAWVNVRQDTPRWLANGQGFIWASEKPGASWQVEWRTPSGDLRRVIVPPNAGFRSLIHVDPIHGALAFTARPDPTQWKVFRATLDGSEYAELTREPGCHGASFDDHQTVFAHSTASLQEMPLTFVRKLDGTVLGELPSVAEEPPLAPNVELVRTGERDGFHAALVRSRDFNPANRYPVLMYVYGGPLPDWYSGVVVASKPSWLLAQWIADQGFIVVSVDGRGTPGRGHDWERAIYKKFGSVPLEDQVAGLRALGQRYRELDLDRVGIYGWSFGGYLSALAVLKEPGVFKAGVAGAPPTDWYDYDTHYTEQYLGIPPADAAAYEEGSLLPLAPKLTRPLLLIHGTGDDNVYFRHSLKLVDALFRAGKKAEILPLSGLTHMVPDPVVNEQLYSRLVRFFQEHLDPARRPGEGR